MTTLGAPLTGGVLGTSQHMRALASGNRIRLARVAVRSELRALGHDAARERVADILLDPPAELEEMPVGRLLTHIPGIRCRMSDLILDAFGVYPGLALAAVPVGRARELAGVLRDTRLPMTGSSWGVWMRRAGDGTLRDAAGRRA